MLFFHHLCGKIAGPRMFAVSRSSLSCNDFWLIGIKWVSGVLIPLVILCQAL